MDVILSDSVHWLIDWVVDLGKLTDVGLLCLHVTRFDNYSANLNLRLSESASVSEEQLVIEKVLECLVVKAEVAIRLICGNTERRFRLMERLVQVKDRINDMAKRRETFHVEAKQ